MVDHTLGLWTNITDHNGQTLILSGKLIIAEVQRWGPEHRDERAAIIELITSAPRHKEERDELLKVVELCKTMIDEALPKFNWDDSALDANAIDLLNSSGLAIKAVLVKIESRNANLQKG